MLRTVVTALLLLSLWPIAGWSGSYEGIARCFEEDTSVPNENAGCVLGRPKNLHPSCTTCMNQPDDPACCRVTPFGVVHPIGYTGNESVLEVRICVEAGSMALEPAVQRAVATWEGLVPTTQNSRGAETPESLSVSYGNKMPRLSERTLPT